jgi:hypothetical protein
MNKILQSLIIIAQRSENVNYLHSNILENTKMIIFGWRKMKLNLLSESKKIKTFYKGMDDKALKSLKKTSIPGFLGSLELGMIYAEPSLTGSADETRYLISADVDMSKVKNMSSKVPDMSTWSRTGPMGHLQNEIWTAEGSGHGDYEAVYCGKPVRWKLEQTFHGDKEWQKAFNAINGE